MRHHPGKLLQNLLLERFIQAHRTEVLIAYVFKSLEQVRESRAVWLEPYNEERPHDVFVGLPPALYQVFATT